MTGGSLRAGVAVVVLTGLGAGAAGAQEADLTAGDGLWSGALEILGQELGFGVRFHRDLEALRATMDIPAQGAHGLELVNVSATGSRVHFELRAGPGLAVWDGEIAGDVVEGEFTQGGARGVFRMKRGTGTPRPEVEPAAPVPWRSEEVEFSNGDIRLAGTLTVPEGDGPFPAVALISGSGPQDRDSDLLGFPMFRALADHLTRHGFAVLRYDDRGVGGSLGSVFLATTSDFADDALAAVRRLAAHPEVDADRVGLVGHSEGAVVASLAAARSDSVAFLVLLAGTGVPGAEVIREQGAAIARISGASESDIAASRDLQRRMFEAVIAGEDLMPFRSEVETSIRNGIEALPPAERAAIVDVEEYVDRQASAQMAQIQTPWFRFFLGYDPTGALREVAVPVLALFGERDLQVTPAQNRPPVAEALAGNPDATLEVIPGVNHLFQTAGTGSPVEYATLDKRFGPGVLERISGWILERIGS